MHSIYTELIPYSWIVDNGWL